MRFFTYFTGCYHLQSPVVDSGYAPLYHIYRLCQAKGHRHKQCISDAYDENKHSTGYKAGNVYDLYKLIHLQSP